MRDVIIYSTRLRYEADMVALALEEAGVPHFCKQTGGPSYTAAQGPGMFFVIMVPEVALDEAEEILQSLPLSAHDAPSSRFDGPSSRFDGPSSAEHSSPAQRMAQFVVTAILLFIAAQMLYGAFRAFMGR